MLTSCDPVPPAASQASLVCPRCVRPSRCQRAQQPSSAISSRCLPNLPNLPRRCHRHCHRYPGAICRHPQQPCSASCSPRLFPSCPGCAQQPVDSQQPSSASCSSGFVPSCPGYAQQPVDSQQPSSASCSSGFVPSCPGYAQQPVHPQQPSFAQQPRRWQPRCLRHCCFLARCCLPAHQLAHRGLQGCGQQPRRLHRHGRSRCLRRCHPCLDLVCSHRWTSPIASLMIPGGFYNEKRGSGLPFFLARGESENGLDNTFRYILERMAV